jgi:hypothetical protein
VAPDGATSMLAPYPADPMEAFAVSTAINSPGRDAPEMVAPVLPKLSIPPSGRETLGSESHRGSEQK